MPFDLRQTDKLLSTTRAVRRRLDLKRDVPDEILQQCIQLAAQAPSGADIASRRWIVVRDPDIKAKLAALYRAAGAGGIVEAAERQRGKGHPKQRVMDSAAHLAVNMERVPALVLVTILGRHDGSGRPGLFDSVIQAAWSFCLALRSRGLGSAWTTMHLGKSDEIAQLLGIPDTASQVVLLPVAWTIGDDFQPAARRHASEITWYDSWGFTRARPDQTDSLLDMLPGVTVEADVAAPPERIWELISDINLPAQFSEEFQGAEWLDGGGPRVGASFRGRNERPDRQWETTSYIVACEQPTVFAWNVNASDHPSAQWRFELEQVGESARLRFSMIIGPGVSGTARALDDSPEEAAQILAARQKVHRDNMDLTVQGIKRIAESGS